MDGLGGRRQRPVQGFGGLGFWGVIVSAVMVLSALFVPAAAGAQDGPPVVVPEFCGPLSDVLGSTILIVLGDGSRDELAAAVAELRDDLHLAIFLKIFANSVINDDRIVERIADDCQQRRDAVVSRIPTTP